jgi:hypothetical protein
MGICRWVAELGGRIAEMGQGAAGNRAEGKRPARLRGGTVALIVERTFAWLGRYRRLKSDYERLPASTEAIIHIAMIRLMVRRLPV